jgi:hypothetical protein
VVVLVDGLRNYMTKHLSLEWMVENLVYPLSKLDDPNSKFISMRLSDLSL